MSSGLLTQLSGIALVGRSTAVYVTSGSHDPRFCLSVNVYVIPALSLGEIAAAAGFNPLWLGPAVVQGIVSLSSDRMIKTSW